MSQPIHAVPTYFRFKALGPIFLAKVRIETFFISTCSLSDLDPPDYVDCYTLAGLGKN